MSTNAVENTEAVAAAPVDATAPTAVENMTDALANTTISDETSAADAAHAASAAEGRRLYIGNLSYATTDEELRAFFSGFEIESSSIPTNPRSGRPVGYAFVDLKTKEEAERAIVELSGKEVSERKVSVQVAKKPGTASSKREAYNNHSDEQQQEDGEHQQQGGRRGGRNSRRGRGRGGRARGGNRANYNASGEATAEEGTTPTANVLPLTEATNTTEAPSSGDAPAAPTGPSAEGDNANFRGRRRGPPENGVPSATKVMVANLPYELTQEELFADYDPESATIALRPIPRYMVRKLQLRGEPRKGRGFGFVTLASEEMQKKAVSEMNGRMVNDREIAVKVAIDNPKIEGEIEEAKKQQQQQQEGSQEAKQEETKENGVAETLPTAAY
ncbi:RNA-binding domain-containing protein [Morchella conica CCBAS932]|uniref:RNA-binding domain-containing protein n=1 Tax=Morchella conica CCBAS932 TaxID=1392247 RepID=A0A3N4KG92_9PEZI|nr:RNA-binding domain-containing protein [Morchella conica CCBAS932]